jgi:hypothetical protein
MGNFLKFSVVFRWSRSTTSALSRSRRMRYTRPKHEATGPDLPTLARSPLSASSGSYRCPLISQLDIDSRLFCCAHSETHGLLVCNLAVLLDVMGSSRFLVFAILELAIALKGYIGFRRYPTSRSAGIIELFGKKKNSYKRQRPLLAYLFIYI